MKMQLSRVLGSLAVLGCLTGISHGTTIGFVGAAGVNQQIPGDYGSNAAADATGWTTSDGTGATPDVSLNWPLPGTGGDSDWEFHSAGTFTPLENRTAGGAWDGGPGNAVAQTQEGPLEINFSVPAGVRFVLNSFDIGNATDQQDDEGPYGWDLSLVRDSDAAEVWSHTTASFGPGEDESVVVNYMGGPGKDYTLNFVRGPGGNGVTYRSGIDNLSFSQIPEPSTLALLAMCGLVVVVVQRRR